MKDLTAVIVKGNPKYIKGNKDADQFYTELKVFLENLGFRVSFDAGKPYTSPKNANVWIGHSRGADRLRFASPGIKTIAIGINFPGAVNHPKDKAGKNNNPGLIPNSYHYILTEEMKQKIEKLINN